MSVLTPDAPTSNRSPTFHRPVAPAPNIERDGEMLNYYFDSTWTTKDIADHFKLTVPQVAAWFQRPDIAALIDFVTAANDRRARDIARENLPGTIDILLRISRLRNDDKVSRAASSALITFARGRAASKTAASTRARRADSSPPRELPSAPPVHHDHGDARRNDDVADLGLGEHATSAPGRQAHSDQQTHVERATEPTDHAPQPICAPKPLRVSVPSRPGSAADLIARAGTTYGPPAAGQLTIDPTFPAAPALDTQPTPAFPLLTRVSSFGNSHVHDAATPIVSKACA